MISTVSQRYLHWQALTPDYWARNMREPVQFAAAVEALIADGYATFLEVGAHPIHMKDIAVCLQQTGNVLPSLWRGRDEHACMLASLGALHCLGWSVNWSSLYPAGQQTSLPIYAWQRMRLWLPAAGGWSPSTDSSLPGAPALRLADGGSTRAETLLSSGENNARLLSLLETYTPPSSAEPGTWSWDGRVSLATAPYLRDHQVQDFFVMSGATYLDAALAAARHLYPERVAHLEQVQFHHLLILSDEVRQHQLILTEEPGGNSQEKQIRFQYRSRPSDAHQPSEWTIHATGLLCLEPFTAGVSQEKESISALLAVHRDRERRGRIRPVR
jgi:acyl transferase domain-containing protein